MTAGYVIGAAMFRDVNNSMSLKIVISVYMLIIILWFYRYGYQLYPN